MCSQLGALFGHAWHAQAAAQGLLPGDDLVQHHSEAAVAGGRWEGGMREGGRVHGWVGISAPQEGLEFGVLWVINQLAATHL